MVNASLSSRLDLSTFSVGRRGRKLPKPMTANLFKKLVKGSPLAPALRALNSLFGSVSVSRNPFLTKRSVADVIAKASCENIVRPQAI
jgi:hypothetical protein